MIHKEGAVTACICGGGCPIVTVMCLDYATARPMRYPEATALQAEHPGHAVVVSHHPGVSNVR